MKKLFGSAAMFGCMASLTLTMFFTGCVEHKTVYVQPDGSPASGTTSDGGLDDAAAEGASIPALPPKAECERYLQCVNQQDPGAGGAAVALYGDASPCWKGSSADAQQCGDACRTARLYRAHDGILAPACGCTGDGECKGSFCAAEGACASESWGAALQECKAVQAKALAPNPTDLQGTPCWAIEALRCDAIKSLYRDGSLVDSTGRYISDSVLRQVYACGLAPGARLELRGELDRRLLPLDAPAACRNTPVIALVRLACSQSESSADLYEIHAVQ